mmetsp:Transcript_24097/g.55443  ORF Transcript_24097/g.55443 Transcript_24097/m.55443 type:complete len:338 (-) Transcript_24097:364-1377(-)|eukprot:CAMPEP_0182587400 /NCGR_PEP_ID=MMETSP1324-20130603/64938_1 /TAXON_ID=236786 /ORGANISM="Florenciella sp., Strain RCC1587" /LENGTH=337 /DNA_ID=CAMNT_0024804391 /DNA_START=207 /DNA_END=1220 /DNA_ORIENTATION=-
MADKTMRFDTTTGRTFDAVYEGENANAIISHDESVMSLNARVQENRQTQIELSGANQLDIRHPNRTKTADGKRLPLLRAHKPLPAFDTEARTAQRDAPSDASVYGDMLRDQRSSAASIKAARSKSNLRIAHTNDHIASWNKRTEWKGLDPSIPKATPIRQGAGEGIYGTDSDLTSYETSAKTAMRDGVVNKLAALPMQSHLATAAERRLKLAGAHWQIGNEPENEFWNKRRASKAQPDLSPLRRGHHPAMILPPTDVKPSYQMGKEFKMRALKSQVELGKDETEYSTSMQRAIPNHSIRSTFDRVTDRTFDARDGFLANKMKYGKSSVKLGDHPQYM